MSDPTGLGAIQAVDYTMILCEDISRMRAFYVDVLGLEVQRDIPGRYLELNMGSTTLAFRLRSRSYDGSAPDAATASLQLAFKVQPTDVEIAAQQLVDAGIELLEPVSDLADFGHRVVFFADPENNVIEIFAEI